MWKRGFVNYWNMLKWLICTFYKKTHTLGLSHNHLWCCVPHTHPTESAGFFPHFGDCSYGNLKEAGVFQHKAYSSACIIALSSFICQSMLIMTINIIHICVCRHSKHTISKLGQEITPLYWVSNSRLEWVLPVEEDFGEELSGKITAVPFWISMSEIPRVTPSWPRLWS